MLTQFDSSPDRAYSHSIKLEKKNKPERKRKEKKKKKKKKKKWRSLRIGTKGRHSCGGKRRQRGDHSCVAQSIYLLYSTCIRISSDSNSLFSVSFTLVSLTWQNNHSQTTPNSDSAAVKKLPSLLSWIQSTALHTNGRGNTRTDVRCARMSTVPRTSCNGRGDWFMFVLETWLLLGSGKQEEG